MAVQINVHGGAVDDIVESAGVASLVGRMLAAGADAARGGAPSDTGALRGSITVDHDGSSGRYGSDLEYARHVEFGTSDTPAQPFLRPSIDAMKNAAT